MQRLFLSVLCLLVVFLNPRCLLTPSSPDDGSDQPALTLLKSDVSRDTAPNVTDIDLAALASGNSEFAFDLYGQLRAEPGNMVYSPYSISLALAMTYAGARNVTSTQMAGTLHFTLTDSALHPAFNKLDLELTSRGQGAQGREGEGFRLSIANALWGQTGFPFDDGYVDLLGLNYGAGMNLLDFMTAPDPSRIVINDWVAEQTEDKILDLLPQGSITSLTRLVLTNAIYFDAMWQDTFLTESTSDQPFHLGDGGSVVVPTMHQTGNFAYAEAAGWQAVEMLYDGGEMSMVIVLPAEGQLDAVETQLNNAFFAGLVEGLSTSYVAISLPKFEFTTPSVSLRQMLVDLGMVDAFDAFSADFSGICDPAALPLYITDVVHKAFVAVDEKGTTAAAATAVIVGTTSVPPEPVYFTADRPFIFAIRDIATGSLLFVGRVSDPSQG